MKTIVLDPGHGGNDPGATGHGLEEKDIVLELARRTGQYLKKHFSCQVKLTRAKDKFLSLTERTNLANNRDADYFCSFHVNAGGGHGFESYIYNGDWNGKQETNRMRNHIHKAIMDHTDWNNRGRKEANFHVVRETDMPASLLEFGFIDNPSDVKKLNRDTFLDVLAEATAEGIARALDLPRVKNKPERVKNKPEPGSLYRVQVGAFKDKENAEQLAKELEDRGYDTWLTK